MATLFSNRSEPTPTSLPAYTPAQPIDYTALPVVEDAGPLQRLGALPRRVLGLIALLLVVGIGSVAWAMLQINKPVAVAPLPPPLPVLAINDASVTGERAINVQGTITNATNGMTVTAQLLENGEPIAWADPASSAAEVKRGKVDLRLTRATDWQQPLDANAAYVVQMLSSASEPVTATLQISPAVAGAFYRGGAPEVAEVLTATTAPTVAPTVAPTTAPTVAPTAAPATPPTLVTGANATLLVSPTLGSRLLTTLPANQKLTPMLRTGDGKFFLVEQGDLVGWLGTDQAAIDGTQVHAIKLVAPPIGAANAGPYTAGVFNGGNIRYRPNIQTGIVLGQMIAGQTVTLKEKLANGSWYHVVAPAAEGWVARDLLNIDPKTLASVPIAP